MQYNTLCLCATALVVAVYAPRSLPTPTTTSPLPTTTLALLTNTSLPPPATSMPPTGTPTATPPKLISELDTTLANLAEKNLFSGSVLIGRQGTILLSRGYGLADRKQHISNTAQTRFRLGSLTKQFTALAILVLESQGKLNVKDPICTYLVDCPNAWKAITIHRLLTHTSGIPDFTSLTDYTSTRATPSTPNQTIARFKDLPLDFQPGEKWSYSNSGYVLLGKIIEKVSGQSYEDFLHESIFSPLNLHDTGYDHNANNLAVGYSDWYSDLPADYIDMSIPYAAGALYSTVEDLYQWEQALFTEQLVSRSYLDAMFAPEADIPDGGGWAYGSGGWAYGYGWFIGTERGRSVAQHGGGIEGFANIVTRYPKEQIVIIVLSNEQNRDVYNIHDTLSNILFGDK